MTHDVNLLAIISDGTKNVVMKFLIGQQGKHYQLIECQQRLYNVVPKLLGWKSEEA